ncbi:MAG TPA: cobalamin-binding protein [Longimicrobiales bacterium]|nr:cobalamin-binding protein [Longimicrobiales bacterium]
MPAARAAAANGIAASEAGAQRVVSLLASGTEIVHALGAADRLVGISHECDWPPEVLDRPRLSRPRFDPSGLDSGEIDTAVRIAMAEHGSVYEVDAERLAALAPDLVISQAVCEVCAVPTPGVRDLMRTRGIDARLLSLDAHTIDEIQQSIREVGAALGLEARAEQLLEEHEARIARVERAVAGRQRRRVLALEWLDPPFAPGHWLPEMIEIAGGENLLGTAGSHSTQHAWEDVAGLDPDVLIVMPCGYGLDASITDADRFADDLRRVAPRAISSGNAFAVDGSAYFNRSGPRYIDGIEILAGLLHPDVFAAPDATVAARWQA